VAQIGNKQNAAINGEYAKHVRADGKRITSGKRRIQSKEILRKEKEERNRKQRENYARRKSLIELHPQYPFL